MTEEFPEPKYVDISGHVVTNLAIGLNGTTGICPETKRRVYVKELRE